MAEQLLKLDPSGRPVTGFLNAANETTPVSNADPIPSGAYVWTGAAFVKMGGATVMTDGVAAGPGAFVEAFPVLYNGTGGDAMRGNVEATVLASAARTATNQSPDQKNVNARGLIVWFDVTVNPGGAQTLKLDVTVKNPVTGAYQALITQAATATPGGTFMVYPGLNTGQVPTGLTAVANGVLSRTWRVEITHSAAGSWTYSVGACTLL